MSTRPAEPRRAAGPAGVLLAAGGACSYGVATVLGRGLAGDGVTAGTALGIRFAVAALVLAVLLRIRGASWRPLPGEWLRIVLLGAVGYALESNLFYFALQRGTAAACVLLFYAYPAIVTLIEVARRRERLAPATAAALVLSVAGTAAVVAAGHDVSISSTGMVLALAAATAYAGYLVIGREFGRRTDAMTAACWVAAGASASSLVRGAVADQLSDPRGHLLPLAAYGTVTAAAFALTFAALARLGAGQTAVMGTLEAVSTVLLAAAFLGEDVAAVQLLGGIGVVAAAVVIAWTHLPRRSRQSQSVRPVPARLVAAGMDADDAAGHVHRPDVPPPPADDPPPPTARYW